MILGSHNTMTYKTPKQWYFRLLPYLFRCQNKDYRRQHELGAMGYDLRLFWHKGELEFRHGLLRFDASDIDDILDYADSHGLVVRLVLETRTYNVNKIKDIEDIREKFKAFCKDVEARFPNALFCCGEENATKEVLYAFKNDHGIVIDELHSSVTTLFDKCDNGLLRAIDDAFPIIYALLRNRRNIKAYNEDEAKKNTYLFIDYMSIQ